MAGSRWVLYAARLGAVLMVLAGSAWVWASAQRWWPDCPGQSLGSPACTELQDHKYDYLIPSEPWIPVGSAASAAGAGCLLLAIGLLLVVPALAQDRAGGVAAAGLVLQALALVPVGAATLLSGRAGRPVDVPMLIAAARLWALFLPLPLVALAVGFYFSDADGRRVRLVVALVLASPLVEYVLMMMVYGSHDTPPWSGVLSGVALVGAGMAAWWLPHPSGRQRDREGRVTRLARQVDPSAVGVGDRGHDAQP